MLRNMSHSVKCKPDDIFFFCVCLCQLVTCETALHCPFWSRMRNNIPIFTLLSSQPTHPAKKMKPRKREAARCYILYLRHLSVHSSTHQSIRLFFPSSLLSFVVLCNHIRKKRLRTATSLALIPYSLIFFSFFFSPIVLSLFPFFPAFFCVPPSILFSLGALRFYVGS